MNEQLIEQEINLLEADNAAMLTKIYAVGAAGAIAGLVLANKQGRSVWGKIGYFFTGGFLARIPMVMIYSKKIAENNAKIENLRLQLPEPVSLFEQLQQNLANE